MRLSVALMAFFLALPGATALADDDDEDPVACFTFSPSSPATGDTVTFNSSCSHDPDGAISSRQWDLDNNGTYDASGLTASRSFATGGTYTVKLRVTDNDGDRDTTTRTITVTNRPPVASFAVNPSSPLSLELVTFTSTSTDPDGTISSRNWDLDNDGAFDDASGGTATRTFSAPGDYTVRLRVVDNRGASDIEAVVVTVRNRAPGAVFSRNPASPLSLTQVTFTSTSSDPDGSLASQTWDFDNDGDFDDGSGASVTRTFNTSGDHVVKLRVVDNKGAETIATTTVAVGNRAPSAVFAQGPDAPLSAETVTFTSSSSDLDGTLSSQSWDLDDDGDFDDAGGEVASRSFATPGDHVVKLRVVDNSGAETISARTVSIGNRAPAAAFAHGPDAPLSAEPVTFTSSSADPDGTIASQSWDLDGDGEFDDADGASAAREFSRPGDHSVSLRVVDNLGAEMIATRTVTIGNRVPTAAFSFGPDSPLSDDEVTFTSSAADPDGTVEEQAWDLDGDGQFDDATGPSAARAFPAGEHGVALQVTDDFGGVATESQTVRVSARPAPPEGGGGQGGTASDTFDNSSPVGEVPTPGPVTSPVDELRSIVPFPIVRIRGRTDPRGARVSLLSVRAPAGVRVALRCRGADCPARRASRRVTTAGTRRTGVARFRRFETHLRTGTVLEIFATQPGRVGKYTRFTIRKLLPPRRQDRCVMPGTLRAASCPGAP